jgi:hypothetical protein
MNEKILTAQVVFDGGRCVYSQREAFLEEMALFFQEAQGDELILVKFRYMSKEDFEKLEEFQGW